MGSPEFALPSLKRLASDEKINVDLVVTQPPRKTGRGQKKTVTPVEKKSAKLNLEVMSFQDVNWPEALEVLSSRNPDFFVVVAFGQILKRKALNIPSAAPVNLHASLLPRYRGSSPIQHAIINGDKYSGVTTLIMDEDIDTGDVLLKRKVPIDSEDTAGSLHDRLAEEGADLLCDTLKSYYQGEIEPSPQNESRASYTPKLTREDGRLNFEKSAEELVDFIRGMNPWPGAYTTFRNKRLKVWKAKTAPDSKSFDDSGRPGAVIRAGSNDKLQVAAGRGVLQILSLQPEGGQRMQAEDFINGYQPEPGELLGG